jgi:hypothetical protein
MASESKGQDRPALADAAFSDATAALKLVERENLKRAWAELREVCDTFRQERDAAREALQQAKAEYERLSRRRALERQAESERRLQEEAK